MDKWFPFGDQERRADELWCLANTEIAASGSLAATCNKSRVWQFE